MTYIHDGGPAFPQPDLSGYGMGPVETDDGKYQMQGMTLRDWFATHAPEKDIYRYQEFEFDGESMSMKSTYTREQARYRYADAMLKARETDQ